jgi:AcrR family transcriptional regulator
MEETMTVKGYVASSRTRRRIYNAAMNLFLLKGYDATTLADIAREADVSTGTLYRYYPAKGDFLTEIGKESVERLRKTVEGIPEDMPVRQAVLSVMIQDIKGTLGVFFSPKETKGGTVYMANDIRMAYCREIYSSKDHLDRELSTRRELAMIYAGIVESAIERGELETTFDPRLYGQMIVAIFFSEFDKGMYQYEYPYEEVFKEKIDILFEGKVSQVEGEEIRKDMGVSKA